MIFLFDFEGTLSDHKWREHLFPTKEDREKYSKQELQWKYNKAHSEIFKDEPKHNNCLLYKICSLRSKVVILTAVRDILDHRLQIETWLKQWSIPIPDGLIMRPKDNFQTSPEFKLDICNILLQQDSVFVFDDREDVIQKLMHNGIPGIIMS